MKFVFVIALLCMKLVDCRQNVYRAAVVDSKAFRSYASMIQEAGKMNADILMLPPETFAENDDYDEVTRSLSNEAKKAGLYVVAHLQEKTRCQNREEVIRNNLVFDRRGTIVAEFPSANDVWKKDWVQIIRECRNQHNWKPSKSSVICSNHFEEHDLYTTKGGLLRVVAYAVPNKSYRKPLNKGTNCTVSSEPPTFATDFGVTFGLLMEDDLVLQKLGNFNLKNYLVTGSLTTDVPYLKGTQFSTSFAFVTGANLMTSSGIISGKSGLMPVSGNIAVAALKKDGGKGEESLHVNPSELHFPEDLGQYIIRPLNLEASVQGYKETVCHGKFCCEFDIKTKYYGPSETEGSYGLAVFEGVRHYTKNQYIGAQTCCLVACAGLYKRSCNLGPNNSTNTHFERVTISGNFTKDKTAQFPVVLSTSPLQHINFEPKILNNKNQVSISVEDGKNLLQFGIFGRDYSKDFIDNVRSDDYSENFYDYIFNDDVQEFFDYLWIRVRILIFIVSVYVLEML